MRKRLLFLAASLAVTAAAGTLIPTKATLVSDRSKAAEVDLKANGLLALVRDTGFDVGVRMDLMRVSDQERYRILLDPLRDPAATRWLSPTLVLQQLPEGRYTAVHILLGSDQTQAFKTDTFEIKKGRILSLGRLRIWPVKNFLGFMKELRVESVGDSGLPALKGISAYGIATLPVDVHPVRWAKEAP
jgi:hypothetical protein